MTSKGDFYAPQNEQPYQVAGQVPYKEQQDYEILEAGLGPNVNTGGRSSAVELEKQLRLGEERRKAVSISYCCVCTGRDSGELTFQKIP